MFSHLWGMRVAAIVAAAASLSACRTFSPDGGMDTVATVAGTGLNKDVVQVRSAEDAAAVRTRVTRLLHRPLSADAAVQIALLNNLGLQAAYNRLGIAEALAVKASRPPALSFPISEVSTPVELDIERKIIGSLLSLLTMPARTKIAADQFAQAELRAAEETLRVAAETRRAYVRAVAARQIVAALGEAKAKCRASAELAGQLKQTGAVNKLDQARRAGVRHRDGRRVRRRPPAGDRRAREAHAAHGALAHRSRRLSAERAAAIAGLDAKRQGHRAGRAQRSRRCADGAARNGGDGEVLWAHAQDAFPQRARRRRHLQDAEG